MRAPPFLQAGEFMGMFCQVCKSLMFPGNDGTLECKKCETTSESQNTPTVTAKQEDREIVILEDAGGILPTTKVHCTKCGHNVAEWQTRQMRAADEAPTRIYRCVKCMHTWREND